MRLRIKHQALTTACFYLLVAGGWVFLASALPPGPHPSQPDEGWSFLRDWRAWILVWGGAVFCYLCFQRQEARLRQRESDLRQTEASAQVRHDQSIAILDNAADGILAADQFGTIQIFNPAAAKIFGYEASEVIGQNIKCLIPRPYLPEHESYRVVNSSGPAGSPATLAMGREVTGVRKDGERFPVELAVSEVGQGESRTYIAIVRDISDRKQAEHELTRSREQLRSLAGRLQTVREEERTRIAREIHDELGQALTGVKMDLAWLQARLSGKEEALKDRVRSTLGLVDSTIQTVRKIATELRPGILDNLGLAAALEWQAGEFESRTGILCRCEARVGPEEVHPDHGTAFFRIFQETLTNVARHARASEVQARLEKLSDEIVLEIQDNGCGISSHALAAEQSLGLLGIRERAAMWGGEVIIRGNPGHGTTLVARIPRGKHTFAASHA